MASKEAADDGSTGLRVLTEDASQRNKTERQAPAP